MSGLVTAEPPGGCSVYPTSSVMSAPLPTVIVYDGQFTYLRSNAQESPALYEAVDGDPSLVAYDLTEDGLFILRRRLNSGWLQIGARRAIWRYEPER